MHSLSSRTNALDGDAAQTSVPLLAHVAGPARLRKWEYRDHHQKIEAVGRLAGGIAHDFNNILTVINGFSDMALATLPDHDPAKAFVSEVRKAGEKAAALTRQLLAFSRREDLPEKVFDLRNTASDLNKMLARVIGEDVRLEITCGPEATWIRANPGHIEQVMLNLAVNARDAMPGGGRLRIEVDSVQVRTGRRIDSGVLESGAYSILRVQDTGSGMTEEVRRRLFEPFFTTKGPGNGTGLGLATVYAIVQQTGGQIEVHSVLDQGTTFTIYFPSASPAESDSARAGSSSRFLSGAETILLVEDDEELRMLALRALQDAGYSVLDAASGEAALRVTESFPVSIDLVVTDVVMPLLDGRQLVEKLKRSRPSIKALYISGYTDHELRQHGIDADHVHLIRKPASMSTLLAKVREVLAATASR